MRKMGNVVDRSSLLLFMPDDIKGLVSDAASKIRVSMSEWIRIAIREKIERDAAKK